MDRQMVFLLKIHIIIMSIKFFFTCMNTNVVDELVLCLEGCAIARTSSPVASVVDVF